MMQFFCPLERRQKEINVITNQLGIKKMKTVVPLFHCCRSTFSNVHVQSGIFPNDTCRFSNDRVAAPCVTCFLDYVQSGGSIYIYKHSRKRALALQWRSYPHMSGASIFHVPCSMFHVRAALLFLCVSCVVFLQGCGLRSAITPTGDWPDSNGVSGNCRLSRGGRLTRQSSSLSAARFPTVTVAVKPGSDC